MSRGLCNDGVHGHLAHPSRRETEEPELRIHSDLGLRPGTRPVASGTEPPLRDAAAAGVPSAARPAVPARAGSPVRAPGPAPPASPPRPPGPDAGTAAPTPRAGRPRTLRGPHGRAEPRSPGRGGAARRGEWGPRTPSGAGAPPGRELGAGRGWPTASPRGSETRPRRDPETWQAGDKGGTLCLAKEAS